MIGMGPARRRREEAGAARGRLGRGAIAVGILLLAGLHPGAAAARTLRVLATGVFATSLPDLRASFEADSGVDLELTVANAGKLAAKLAEGDSADVVMTSAAGIDALVRQGKLDASSRIEIGRMRLGLGVRDGASLQAPRSAEEVRAALIAAPAVAAIDPSGGATAGKLSEAVFERLGIADAVHAKAILCGDGAEVVAALKTGRATVGMAQASELIGAPGIAFAGYLPDPLNVATAYGAAADPSRDPGAAAAFLRFMRGPVATDRLRRAGWDVAKP